LAEPTPPMPRHFATTVLLSALLSSVAAQELVLPAGTYFDQPALSGLTWRTTAFRFQVVYDSSHFTGQGVSGPIQISRLRFRAADNAVSSGGSVYAGVTIQMSSCPLDYAAMSSTFAANRGPDLQTVFAGAVSTLPALGGAPNSYVLDVVLGSPFTYDPTLGLDLCIEVDAPAPLPTLGVPNLATSSNVAAQRAQRLSASSQLATGGNLSPLANVILIDFAGSGGYPTWSEASSVNTGAGCYGHGRSFYESFTPGGAMDLSDSTLSLLPNGNGGYNVQRVGPTLFFPHGGTSLGLTDDSGVQIALPASFGALPYPGGSTTSIYVCSNGFLWLAPPAVPDNDSQPDSGRLVGLGPRLAPFWHDLLPTAANNVYFDVDPNGTTVYVTWNDVPSYTTPAARTNLQVALNSSGTVEFRYGQVHGGRQAAIVGWSPGNGAADVGSTDLSSQLAFTTGLPEQMPLTLRGTVPQLGTTLTQTLTGVPPASLLSLRLLGFTAVAAPLDLGLIGAPGCRQYIGASGLATSVMSGAVPTITFFIPPVPAYLGAVLYAQALTLSPGANASGILSSNLVTSTIGN
jgi:hypothetical protein